MRGPPVNPLLQSHARLREAERLRQSKALDKAQAICAELLKAHPDYVGALQTLGLVLADRRDYEAARLHLSRAAMLSPRDWKILTALAGIYLKLGASEMAMRTLEQAQRLMPGDASIVATLAEIYREEREYELACSAYEKAYSLDRSLKAMRLGLGWSLTHLGRTEEAAQIFHSMVHDDPQDAPALLALSQMPAGIVNMDVLKRLEELRAPDGKRSDGFETMIGFGRAAALDRAQHYSEAWSALVATNAKVFATVADQASKEEASRLRHLEHLKGLSGTGARAPAVKSACQSLFILGPSRSGKTTMERLVALLPGVRRGYENPIVENAIRHTFQSSGLVTRSQLVELPPQLDEIFRETYLAELKERAAGAQLFTNTHPARIIDAWRFAMAVPDARFVFIKRDVHDLALRIFMKQYKSGHPYSYDLAATFRYVAWYHEMMEQTQRLWPGIVRIVSYEDMISDPHSALARVAELCGLAVRDLDLARPGDDRGAATPYRERMAEALGGA
ncbi:tetratricopeptide repeat-containing sulfotransferase family protein [Taklimakanibacter lacteus]|uniref:tetratricopeptide repeat-containing sulfotransferase family protein n=1 Tax=Taklimakanibacter lacteus TaxID=2268456 RepID=UPI000E662C8E